MLSRGDFGRFQTRCELFRRFELRTFSLAELRFANVFASTPHGAINFSSHNMSTDLLRNQISFRLARFNFFFFSFAVRKLFRVISHEKIPENRLRRQRKKHKSLDYETTTTLFCSAEKRARLNNFLRFNWAPKHFTSTE